jgi:hypothetical protein
VNKIDLSTQRMAGGGEGSIDAYRVNVLFGLDDLCKKYVTKDACVLELGTNAGVSTSLFAYYANQVVGVDMLLNPLMSGMVDCFNNITFINKTFKDFLAVNTEHYDVIYIDGCHEYENVIVDINDFYPLVKSGGCLAGHDFNNNTPGVEQAVREVFSNEEIEVFSDSSWLIRKP